VILNRHWAGTPNFVTYLQHPKVKSWIGGSDLGGRYINYKIHPEQLFVSISFWEEDLSNKKSQLVLHKWLLCVQFRFKGTQRKFWPLLEKDLNGCENENTDLCIYSSLQALFLYSYVDDLLCAILDALKPEGLLCTWMFLSFHNFWMACINFDALILLHLFTFADMLSQGKLSIVG